MKIMKNTERKDGIYAANALMPVKPSFNKGNIVVIVVKRRFKKLIIDVKTVEKKSPIEANVAKISEKKPPISSKTFKE